MTNKSIINGAVVDRVGRRVVQIGFLLLFLYPFLLLIYQQVTYQSTPAFTSWLLPWDPLLHLGNFLQGNMNFLVIGAPLLLLVMSLVLGRFFCGWVCPMGTLLDGVSWLAFWRRSRDYIRRERLRQAQSKSSSRNSWLRYGILAAVTVGGILSLRWLGLFDPLVIFNRVIASLLANLFSLQQSPYRIFISIVSLVFLFMVVMELWRPRFWCRNLCPLGALISLVSRFSLLNRRVSIACTGCGECRQVCPMNAIPREAHDTDYSDCVFCLECQADCPKGGITFGFGLLAQRKWKSAAQEGMPRTRAGKYVEPARLSQAELTRRDVLQRAVKVGSAGVLGLAVTPLTSIEAPRPILRPPGALPEDEFLRTCILCQECVRVCPTGGLRPTFLQSGIAGIGTPHLIPRQGGCALTPSCPNLCAQVCPVGALQPTRPEELKIGLAHVHRDLCIAWDQGGKCLVCVEACLNHAAIPYHGRVTVDAQKCTGCGRCESGCPVPGSAIRVYPLG